MPVFNFSAVFSRFFKLIGDNFALFALLGLFGNILPTVAASYMLINSMHLITDWSQRFQGASNDGIWYILAASLAVGILNLITLSMITEVAILRAVGKKADIGAILGHALGNIVPIFAISLVVALIVGGGLILLVIPGIFWALCTWVAVPAYIGQPNLGIGGSVSRAFELTRNHRWSLLLLAIVGMLALFAIGAAIGGTKLAITGAAFEPFYQVMDAAIEGVGNLLSSIFAVAVYVCLRESKDKMNPASTASVFE